MFILAYEVGFEIVVVMESFVGRYLIYLRIGHIKYYKSIKDFLKYEIKTIN